MYLISSSGDGHDDIDMKRNSVYGVPVQREAIALQQNPVYGVQGVQMQPTGEETHYANKGMGPEQPHQFDYVATIHWNWSRMRDSELIINVQFKEKG